MEWLAGITKIASLSPGRALSSHCLFVSSHSLCREHSWSCVNDSWDSTDLWEGPDTAPPHNPKCCESYRNAFMYSTTVRRKAIPLPQIKMWNVPVMFCSHKSAPGKVLKLRCWQTMQQRNDKGPHNSSGSHLQLINRMRSQASKGVHRASIKEKAEEGKIWLDFISLFIAC